MVRTVLFASLALATVPAGAQEPPRDISPDLETCSEQSARPVTIEQLHGDPALRFECVSVEGILDGNSIVADRRALVFSVPPFDEDEYEEDEREHARAQAGIPNRIRLQRSGMPRGDGPMRARIVGVANDCAAIYREANAYNDRINAERTDGSISITFLSGTCHYHSEVYIHPVAATFLELEPQIRFTSAEVSPDEAGLVAIEESQVPGTIDLAIGAALVRAIAEGDANAFHMLMSPSGRSNDFAVRGNFTVAGTYVQGIWSGRDPQEWADALEAKYSARQIDLDAADRRRLFLDRSSVEYARAYPEDGIEPEVISCWCKTADCEGKWPVFTSDADARHQRPYLCVTLEGDARTGLDQRVTYARIHTIDYGFAEPDWKIEDEAQ